MAGLTGNTERDLVMLMSKMTEYLQRSLNNQVGRSGSRGNVNLDLQDLIKGVNLTAEEFTELRDQLQKLNMSGEELAEHMTLNLGGLKKVRKRLNAIDTSLDGFGKSIQSNTDSLNAIDKESTELAKALRIINTDSIDLAEHIKQLQDRIQENTEALRRENEVSDGLTEKNEERIKQLEQLILADEDQLHAILSATNVEERRVEATERLTIAQDNLKEVSISAYSKLGDFKVAVDRLSRQNDGLTDITAKVARSSALQNAAQIQFSDQINRNSIEYVGYVDALKDASSSVPEAMLRMAGLLDEQSKAIKDNLEPDDYAALRVSMGEARVLAAESLRGVEGVKNIQDLTEQTQNLGKSGELGKDEKVRAALIALAQRLEMAGMFKSSKASTVKRDISGKIIGTKSLSDLSDKELKDLAQDLAAFDKSIKHSSDRLDRLGVVSQSALGKLAFMTKAAGGASGMLKKLFFDLGTTSIFLGNLWKAVDGAKESFRFIQDFNIAHVPASLGEVAKMSILTGVSMQDMVKILQDNKRALALQGVGAFSGMTDQLKVTFAKFGYTAAQSAEAIGPAIEAAINSGVSIRDPAGLNTFIEQSMAAFKNISGIVNTTAAEYMRLNAQLMQDNDVMALSLGMSKEQHAQYAKGLQVHRDLLVTQGMSLDQAQELVKLREQEKRSKIIGRYKDAAMASAKMQMMGFSGAEASEFMRLKVVGANTDSEKAFVDDVIKRMTMQEDAARQSGLASRDMSLAIAANMPYDVINDKTGSLTGEQDRFRAIIAAERNKSAATGKEAIAAGDLAKGSQTVAEAGNIFNSISSIMDNVFVKTILASSAALAGFTAMLLRAGGWQGIKQIGGDVANGVKGGKGFLGKMGGAVGGLFGMGGPTVASSATSTISTLGKAGSIAKMAGGGLLGIGGGLLANGLVSSGEIGIAKAVAAASDISGGDLAKSVGGNALQWATTLGGLGMLGGPAVAAALAGLGGIAGGAYGLYENAGNISKWWGQGKPAPTASTTLAAPGANNMPGLLNNTQSTSNAVNKDTGTSSAPALLQVSDQTANQKLDNIASSLTEMLTYLKQIAESESPVNRNVDVSKAPWRQIPSVQQAISGRNSA